MSKVCILSSVHSALDNRIFYRQARSLQRAGYHVSLVALHDHDEVKDGIHITALPKVPRWQRPRLWLTLVRHALASQADVFHFHDPELLLAAAWLRWLTGKPTIYDVHESYADFIAIKTYLPAWLRRPAASLFGWLEPKLARLHSGLVFADDHSTASFRHVRCPQATLFNYPERSFVEQAAAASADSPRPPIVLHLGGHEQSRGILTMIQAFQQVVQTLPAARLLLVGPFIPPHLEQNVRADIARRGIEQAVELTGHVPFHQVGHYLRQASVGWIALQPVPKYQKNIPTKLFEYMAYGLPVVSSDLPPIRPFVQHGLNGYLVTADEPGAHAQAIVELLQNPQQARAMGKAGQDLVRTRYNWDEMEKRLLAFYKQVLSQSPGAA